MGVKMSGAKEFDARLAVIGPRGCWGGPQGKPPGRAVLGAARGRPYGAAKPRRPCGPYARSMQKARREDGTAGTEK